MSSQERDQRYDDADRARRLPEPTKRVRAPERTPFERDRARVVHAASLRRLAAKTQVVGPQSDDFVRNRLTHSLEVAQIARDIAHPLGCHPDIAETAALAHDLGHPPFGHNGERALNDLAATIGGFEGNAQTLRILTRLEAKTVHEGRSFGLNLTRATLDACTKYPWGRPEAPEPGGHHTDGTPRTLRKFGVYDADQEAFAWLRQGVPDPRRRCVEAQVMDVADDVAYSVHDFEDGVVAGRIDPASLIDPTIRAAVWDTTRAWYLPDADDDALEEAFGRLRRDARWPAGYAGTRADAAALKNLTSDVIGIFCGRVHEATRDRFGDHPLVRYGADLVVPRTTQLQIAALKGVAAHFVMQAAGRVALMSRQRELLAELHSALRARPELLLDRMLAEDFAAADDDAARERVLIDQVASLTDASAIAWHERTRAQASGGRSL